VVLVPNSLTVYHSFLLSEVSARDVTFLGCSGFSYFLFFSSECLLSIHYHLSHLTCARPKRHPIRFDQFLQRSFFFLSSTVSGGRYLYTLYITGSRSIRRFFFRFGGGRTFYKVQSLILCSPTVDLAVGFPNSSPMVFPKTSLLFPMLSSRGCCLLLRPPTLLAVFLPFLRCSGSSTSRLLTLLLHSSFG
jgi:hypothetical protein